MQNSLQRCTNNPPQLGIYVHVPFCATRCGYCDFNTYTATELGGGGSQAAYAEVAISEIRLAAESLQGRRAVAVFFGGGTPTLLPAEDLTAVLQAIDSEIGLAPNAEVTTEANPDSVTPEMLIALREGGFNRISLGMQSENRDVLATLERTHDPERVPQAVAWAREAGFEQVSLDLIYGTAGESLRHWERTLRAALECGPDHVSAYSLIVEPGTRLARQVDKGLTSAPDEDDLAAKYELADDVLTDAGLSWYEVSNWARGADSECHHNQLYWQSQDWWGIGPGAHSHQSGRRWWNLKHPTAWAQKLGAGALPVAGEERLGSQTRLMERILLETRTRSGLDCDLVDKQAVETITQRGLAVVHDGYLVLTRQGRLLADAVVRELV